MINRPAYITLLLLILTGIGWSACTQQRQPCLTPKIASLIVESVHFTNDTSTKQVDTAIPGATFIPLVPGKDTLQVTTYPQQSAFTLSLSPDSTLCQWEFTTDSIQHIAKYSADTITFLYQRSLKFLSNACGYTYFYSLDSVITTHHIIDSVHILNKSVTNNVNTKHLQIFIHPDF